MASKPGQGTVAQWSAGAATAAPGPAQQPAWTGRYRNGLWRPDVGFAGNFGVTITLRHEPGLTTGDVLRVPFRFQVPAMTDLARSFQYSWTTYDTIRVGQKSRPFGKQLKQLSVSTMLLDPPAADAASGVTIWNGIAAPQRMINELRWIMGEAAGSTPQVFRLVLSQPAVWGSTALINMLATLAVLEPVQRQDEVGTEYLTATFLEFAEDEDVARKQRPQAHGQTRWKLRAGDTLYEIAKRSHWHQPSAWRTIANANGITGVSPSSATELAAWARKHHKTELAIPAKGRA